MCASCAAWSTKTCGRCTASSWSMRSRRSCARRWIDCIGGCASSRCAWRPKAGVDPEASPPTAEALPCPVMIDNREASRILVADDDADVLHALRLLLKGEGYQVETATSPAGVMAAVESNDFDAALVDLNYARDTTSGREGIEL